MKTHLLVAGFMLCFNAIQAQDIKVKDGTKVMVETTRNENTDLGGLGVQMTTESKSVSVISFGKTSNNQLAASFVMDKMKMKVSAGGEDMSYDSDNPEDKDNEIGQTVGEKLHIPVVVNIDTKTGKAIDDKIADSPEKTDDETNPLAAMMPGSSELSEAAAVASIFLFLDPAKKVGDIWMDSSASTPNMKFVKTYTLTELKNNIATLVLNETTAGKSSMDMNGSSFDISIKGKSDTEIILDTKSKLVKQRKAKNDFSGTIDVMGQSMEFSSNGTVEVTYN